MNDSLFEQVKRKLNITWEDDDTNARIEDIIKSSEPIVKDKLGIGAGVTFDFSKPGAENLIFLAYCFYAWNHAENEFSENYANDISETRKRYEVDSYVRSLNEDEESV